MIDLTKEQLEENLRVTKRWLEAIECCTFHGRYATDIAAMVRFIQDQNSSSKVQYESMVEMPTFGKAEVKEHATV